MINFKFDPTIICPEDPTATPERIEGYKSHYATKYLICKLLNPKTIVEIGVRAGYSCWAFFQACPEATIYGFDNNCGEHGGKGGSDGKYKEWAKKLLSDYDFEYFDRNTQQSIFLLFRAGRLPSFADGEIDFFHVDGDHTTEGVYHDLKLAMRHLKEGGYILVDDIDYLPQVKEGVTMFLKDYHVESIYIPSFRGEMLIKKINGVEI